ncbi:hypothetical protein Tsubulata_033430 [Turnera subulata]|uniref:NET domain-containing protein n=1 Tax=Turnera subulata TaxID=218843 RepID=A0A9Q0JI11_9ROSI|nr:hypothetical protein Tsubulata_033430 [Turnera subulata]
MTEKAGDVDTPNGMNTFGPDYFRYYVSQVKDVIEDDFVPSTESRCGEGCLAGNKSARMEALLRQAVTALSPEVEERLQSVLHTCWLHSVVRKQREAEGAAVEGGAGPIQNKRLKTSAPLSPTSILASPMPGLDNNVALPEGGIPNGVKKHCARCGKTNARKWRDEAEGKEQRKQIWCGHRPMKLHEKQQLQRRIQKLSPRNLNRVAEIVQRNKPADQCFDEIFVDLEHQDEVTLQRLYYYVEAVEKGKTHSNLSQFQISVPYDGASLYEGDGIDLCGICTYDGAFLREGVNHEHDSLNVKGEKYTRDLQYLEHLQTRR